MERKLAPVATDAASLVKLCLLAPTTSGPAPRCRLASCASALASVAWRVESASGTAPLGCASCSSSSSSSSTTDECPESSDHTDQSADGFRARCAGALGDAPCCDAWCTCCSSVEPPLLGVLRTGIDGSWMGVCNSGGAAACASALDSTRVGGEGVCNATTTHGRMW